MKTSHFVIIFIIILLIVLASFWYTAKDNERIEGLEQQSDIAAN
jgi:CHASE3 domain sensor protein